MGNRKAILIALSTMLYVLFITAAPIKIKLNVDAKVTATSSADGSKTVANAEANKETSMELPWSGSVNTIDFDFFIEPTESNKYFDTTVTLNISQWWNETFIIDVEAKPLPMDTAYIPVRANVDITLTAKPIKMIKGGNPKDDFSFNIPAKTLDTIKLPVETDLINSIIASNNLTQSVGYTFSKGKVSLSLPLDYLNGHVTLHAISGKIIGQMDLSSQTKNSLSIWDVATGVYILHIQGKNNISYTKKFQHNGGRVLLASEFNSSTVSRAQAVRSAAIERATAQYDFILDASDEKYNDTTITVDLTGQMNGMRAFYLIDPNDTGAKLDQLVDEFSWEELFPNRYGLGYGAYINDPLPEDTTKIQKLKSDGDYDFYTYASLEKALANMSEIEVDLYQLEGHNYMHRIVWRNKKSGETRTMVNNVEYENYKKTSTENLIQTIDYGNFCSEGTIETRKRELSAFLGNISHETTGAGTEEKSKTWGLYWREEAAWQNGSTALGYVDQYPNALYKPTANQSYHGRGPIQITHNVNYGQLSEFLYGDKQILLDDPGKLVPDKPQDATVAFMSAIWFWMTPQAPKPSCHDVMVENWTANSSEASKGWDESRFGMTIYIINGGLECGSGDGKSSPVDRIEFYKRYADVLGVTTEDYCDCGNMKAN